MKHLICAGFALVGTVHLAGAQPLSADDLARRAIERRAVEAAIWGMPAVSMAGVRKSLAGIGAGYNEVVYFSQPLEARHEFLTANNQTPYVLAVLDLHRGSMVLDVPAASSKVALFGSAIDSWEVPLVDAGPSGDDAGKGGKYLFLPPGYSGSRPDGYIVVPSPTNFVHAAFRPIILGQGMFWLGASAASALRPGSVACRAVARVRRPPSPKRACIGLSLHPFVRRWSRSASYWTRKAPCSRTRTIRTRSRCSIPRSRARLIASPIGS